ncbi:hypothetical protein BHE74_00050975 [Ensete ventricosum]|nr:hypothetical protein BHE74_00050975 [Ensete ventricosum]
MHDVIDAHPVSKNHCLIDAFTSPEGTAQDEIKISRPVRVVIPHHSGDEPVLLTMKREKSTVTLVRDQGDIWKMMQRTLTGDCHVEIQRPPAEALTNNKAVFPWPGARARHRNHAPVAYPPTCDACCWAPLPRSSLTTQPGQLCLWLSSVPSPLLSSPRRRTHLESAKRGALNHARRTGIPRREKESCT